LRQSNLKLDALLTKRVKKKKKTEMEGGKAPGSMFKCGVGRSGRREEAELMESTIEKLSSGRAVSHSILAK
jgi:hypothetical protein